MYEGIVNPLDLQTILVNYLAGSYEIFVAIALVMLTVLAAKYKMTNLAFLMLALLFIVLFGGFTLYVLAIFIIGITMYYIISKLIKN